MQKTISAAGEAVTAPHDETYYANIQKARSLAAELSQVLAQIGDSEFAFIRPAGTQFAVCFGGLPYASQDPLSVAIEAYKTGLAAYSAIPEEELVKDEEAVIAETYGPASSALSNWSQPARSREAVVAALELALFENLVVQPFGTALIEACIPYIKGEMI